jgi:hypothetical protein
MRSRTVASSDGDGASSTSFWRRWGAHEDGSFADLLVVADFSDLKAAWEWMESEPFYPDGALASVKMHRFANRW